MLKINYLLNLYSPFYSIQLGILAAFRGRTTRLLAEMCRLFFHYTLLIY